ncbi:MAG: diguanylate cyclase [Gammaproteobacteria bacterium]|nr:diguanylate cyclase [Gammaproteobacteria bacterium]
MSLSIRLKTGLPVAILAIVILLLLFVGGLALSHSQAHSEQLIDWFEEGGKINQLDRHSTELLFPLSVFVMGQHQEHHKFQRQQAQEQLNQLNITLDSLLKQEHMVEEERKKISNIAKHLEAINAVATQILQLQLPKEHDIGMNLIDKIVNLHIAPMHKELERWHSQDMQRVYHIQNSNSLRMQDYFMYASALALLTIILVGYATWVNHNVIIKPVIRIKQMAEKLAGGNLKDRLNFNTKDEIGQLATNIDVMANSMDKMSVQLGQIARVDDLTGLLNQRACDEIITHHTQAGRRYEHYFSILILDIDNFKSVNEKYGRSAGDDTLVKFANIATEQLRECDFMFRIGGEKFLIMLPNTDKTDSENAAERLRKTMLDTSVEVDRKKVKVSLSIGIASFPEDGLEKDELLRKAEQALIQAKSTGRNQTVAFHNPLLL